MSELIYKQKIARRNKQLPSFNNKGSLMVAATKYRAIQQSNRFDIFRARVRRNNRNRGNDRMLGRSKQISPKTANLARNKENVFASFRNRKLIDLHKFFMFLKSLGFKKSLIYSTTFVAILFIAGLSINFIRQKHFYNMLSIHQGIEINDILYENLPTDVSGQGSGEVLGIDPVLITAGKPISYTVKPGDTLSEISHKHNIKIGTLISFNQISDVRRLQVGMKLKIPGFDGIPYEVKSGDSLDIIAQKYDISVNSILDANDLDTAELLPGENLFIPGAVMNEFDFKKAMGTLFMYPTVGRLSSGYGYRPDPFTGRRRFHNGVDLANGKGTTVKSTMSGIVADLGSQPTGYGNYIIIKHANGYQSLYGHLNRISIRRGQYVSQGQKIGEMGNTGRSTGPHLHFSIYKNNVPVNPLNYLW